MTVRVCVCFLILWNYLWRNIRVAWRFTKRGIDDCWSMCLLSYSSRRTLREPVPIGREVLFERYSDFLYFTCVFLSIDFLLQYTVKFTYRYLCKVYTFLILGDNKPVTLYTLPSYWYVWWVVVRSSAVDVDLFVNDPSCFVDNNMMLYY